MTTPFGPWKAAGIRQRRSPWTDSSTIHVSQEESGSGSYVLTNEDESPPESVTATHIGEK
jgi:hypothetical protein